MVDMLELTGTTVAAAQLRQLSCGTCLSPVSAGAIDWQRLSRQLAKRNPLDCGVLRVCSAVNPASLIRCWCWVELLESIPLSTESLPIQRLSSATSFSMRSCWILRLVGLPAATSPFAFLLFADERNGFPFARIPWCWPRLFGLLSGPEWLMFHKKGALEGSSGLKLKLWSAAVA
jgi:hypothetical protein